MKLVLVACLIIMTSPGFAGNFIETVFGTYQSSGTWQDEFNSYGTWSSTLTLERKASQNSDKEAVLYREVISIQDNENVFQMEEVLEFHLQSNDSFKIYFEGNLIGNGNCQEQQCFLTYGIEDTKIEETFHFFSQNQQVDRMGSQYWKDDRVTWQGTGFKSDKF